MKPIDLNSLVAGLLALILISLSFGKYEKLHAFARREAVQALRGWHPHPFFPTGYQVPGSKAQTR